MSFTVEQEIADDIIIKVIRVYEFIVVINSFVKAANLQYANFYLGRDSQYANQALQQNHKLCQLLFIYLSNNSAKQKHL